MSLKDSINALGRDFRDVPVSSLALFFGTLSLVFGFWVAYFGPKSSGTDILFLYLLIMGAACTLPALGSIISAWWRGTKPE